VQVHPVGRVCRDEGGGREQGGGWRRRSGDRTSRTLQRVPILCKELRAVSGGTCFCDDRWLPASDLESLWGPFLRPFARRKGKGRRNLSLRKTAYLYSLTRPESTIGMKVLRHGPGSLSHAHRCIQKGLALRSQGRLLSPSPFHIALSVPDRPRNYPCPLWSASIRRCVPDTLPCPATSHKMGFTTTLAVAAALAIAAAPAATAHSPSAAAASWSDSGPRGPPQWEYLLPASIFAMCAPSAPYPSPIDVPQRTLRAASGRSSVGDVARQEATRLTAEAVANGIPSVLSCPTDMIPRVSTYAGWGEKFSNVPGIGLVSNSHLGLSERIGSRRRSVSGGAQLPRAAPPPVATRAGCPDRPHSRLRATRPRHPLLPLAPHFRCFSVLAKKRRAPARGGRDGAADLMVSLSASTPHLGSGFFDFCLAAPAAFRLRVQLGRSPPPLSSCSFSCSLVWAWRPRRPRSFSPPRTPLIPTLWPPWPRSVLFRARVLGRVAALSS